jgi:hypothetical protein
MEEEIQTNSGEDGGEGSLWNWEGFFFCFWFLFWAGLLR